MARAKTKPKKEEQALIICSHTLTRDTDETLQRLAVVRSRSRGSTRSSVTAWTDGTMSGADRKEQRTETRGSDYVAKAAFDDVVFSCREKLFSTSLLRNRHRLHPPEGTHSSEREGRIKPKYVDIVTGGSKNLSGIFTWTFIPKARPLAVRK
jgi:hypothetical protein